MPEDTLTPKKTEAATPAPLDTVEATAPVELTPEPTKPTEPTPAPAPAPTEPVAPAAPATPTAPIAPAAPATPTEPVAPTAAPTLLAPAAPVAPVVVPVTVVPAAPAPVVPPVTDTVSLKDAAKEAVAEVVAPWFASMGLSEDDNGLMENKKFGSMSDLVTSYRNLEKFAGGSKNVVEIPGDDSSDEVVSAFKQKMGAPASIEDVAIDGLNDAHPKVAEAFKQAVVDNGVPVEAAIKLVEAINEVGNAVEEETIAQKAIEAEQEISVLKQELGAGFEKTVEMAKRAFEGDAGLNGIISAGDMEDKLGVVTAVKVAAKVAEMVSEDSFVEGGGSSAFGLTPEGAKSKEQEILSNPEFKKRYLGGEQTAIDEMTKLKKLQVGVTA